MVRRLLFVVSLILLLTSCGVDGKHFKLEGRFLHLNQGEFYVYSEDGDIDGIDTIKVEGGRFAYEMPCTMPATIVIVFPNFSKQPVFAEPGKTVNIDGDASHLKELKVEGTDDNELMTKFRRQIADASPPEIRKYATMFIGDHPESRVSAWLVKEYFVTSPEPDYRQAQRFVRALLPHQPRNGSLALLNRMLIGLAKTTAGSPLPAFTTTDMNGNRISSTDFSKGLSVISTFASWNYNSREQLRRLNEKRRSSAGRLKVVTLSVDGSQFDCKNALRQDSIQWPVVCDGKMFENGAVKALGLCAVPDNLLIKDGRIIARNLSTDNLVQQIDKNL